MVISDVLGRHLCVYRWYDEFLTAKNACGFSKMKNVNWDAYQIFLAVARHGGLSGAAEQLGASPATIGRRMLDFEQSTKRSLFVRGSTGYGLTADGQVLFEELLAMEGAARRIDAWQQEPGGVTSVRLAAGSWVARMISQNISAICTARDSFSVELHISEKRAQLNHRKNDIGIRAFEPTEGNLAAIKTGEVAYCVYQARNIAAINQGRWIVVDGDLAVSPYLKWPHQNAENSIAVSVDHARGVLDLVLAGAGCAVLPCFVGDMAPQLERVGREIEELRHGQWIVAHNDDRHRHDIRRVLNRVTDLLKSHAKLFEGRRSPTSHSG